MAEPKEDHALQQLRDEVAHKAYMAISLCSISNNNTISPHWRLFNPISELIQASVTDEKTIPYFPSRIDDKVREIRRQLDLSNLNDIITCNVLQMFAGFVKFSKTTPTAAATISDAHAEIERLKGELFNKTTEFERQKQLIEKYEGFQREVYRMMNQFDDYSDGLALVPIKKKESFAGSSYGNMATAPSVKKPPADSPVVQRSQKMHVHTDRRVAGADAKPVVASSSHFAIPHSSINHPSTSASSSSHLPSSSSTSLRPIPTASTTSTPRLDRLSTDQFLDRVLGPNWKANPVEQTPVPVEKRKRTIAELIAELADEGGEKEKETKRSRSGEMCSESGRASEDSYKCPFEECNRSFQKIQTMVDHTTSDHYWIGSLQLQCSKCGHALCDRTFEAHQQHTCPDAHIVFTVSKWNPEETKDEAAARLQREKRLCKCPVDGCNFITKQRFNGMTYHMIKNHKEVGRPSYRCDCGVKRRSFNTILFHLYKECRGSEVNWCLDAPRKKSRVNDDTGN